MTDDCFSFLFVGSIFDINLHVPWKIGNAIIAAPTEVSLNQHLYERNNYLPQIKLHLIESTLIMNFKFVEKQSVTLNFHNSKSLWKFKLGN